jgi:hypothetical protein
MYKFKILNSGRHKKQPNISIENFLQFLKNLNGAPSNFDEIDIPSHSIISLLILS